MPDPRSTPPAALRSEDAGGIAPPARPGPPTRPGPLGATLWTIAAFGAMAVLGAAAAMAKDQFLLFANVMEQGWGILGNAAARRALDVGKIVTSAAGFGAAGAIAPWVLAFAGRRWQRAEGGHADESLAAAVGAYARWMLFGLVGLATLAFFAGFRAADAGTNDYKILWPIVVRCAAVAAAAGAVFEWTRRGRVEADGAVARPGDVPGDATGDATGDAAAKTFRRARALVVVAVVAYALLFSWLSVARHHAFGTDLHDLGLYDQMLWALPRGHGFRVTTWQDHAYDLRQFDNDFAAEHFMPILLLLAPWRLAWEGAEVLLVAQSWWLAAAALALFVAAYDRLRCGWLAVALAIGWLLHPVVQQTNLKDFHADALAPVFLFAMIVAWSRRRPLLYAGMLGAFFCCKEETSLLAAGWAAYLLARGEWRWGAATLAASALHYGFVIKWLIPAARDGEPLRHLYRYAHLAGGVEPRGIGEMMRYALFHPLEVWAWVGTHERVRSLLLIFAPVAFLPLVAPRTWLMLVVPVASALLSNWFIQYRLELHYGLSSVTFAFAAAIFALERWRAPDPAAGPAAPDETADRTSSAAARHRARAARAALGFAILAVGVILWHQHGRTPLSKGYDPLSYLVEPRYAVAKEFIAALPPDAAVSATSAVGVHLTGRLNLFMFPDLPPETEFIFVDTHAAGVLFPSREAYAAHLRELLGSGAWGVWDRTGHREGYLILRRGGDTASNAEVSTRLDMTVRGD